VERNWGITVEFWNTWLRGRGLLAEGKSLEASDGTMMMILAKTARQTYTDKQDNLRDISGYAALTDELKGCK